MAPGALAVVVAVGGAREAWAGAWSKAAPMPGKRAAHVAALLPDGQVLVAGGTAGRKYQGQTWEDYLSDALRYDPSTDTWTKTAPMNAARRYAGAATLADGRVLVVGGNLEGTSDTPEVYDGATSTWIATGELPARFSAALVRLDDGRVLVAGGCDPEGGAARADAWLFDPVTLAWSKTGSLTTPRCAPGGVRLVDGRALVAGGEALDDVPLAGAELYDPATGTFSPTGSMAHGRYPELLALPGGDVLAVGTAHGGGELFSPTSGTFRPTAPRGIEHDWPTATLVANKWALVAGEGGQDDPARAELYEPAGDRWHLAGFLARRRAHTATALADGGVLVAGGWLSGESPFAPTSNAERFSPMKGGEEPCVGGGECLTLACASLACCSFECDPAKDIEYTCSAERPCPEPTMVCSGGDPGVCRGVPAPPSPSSRSCSHLLCVASSPLAGDAATPGASLAATLLFWLRRRRRPRP